MASYITFTDEVGAATLDNDKPAPADRFADWVPISTPIGPRRHTLGGGFISAYVFRTDHGASFKVPMIPNTMAVVAARLRAHLLAGGQCAVFTGDADDNEYLTCELMPETEPTLELSDKAMLEYTLTLDLVRRDGTDSPMVCEY